MDEPVTVVDPAKEPEPSTAHLARRPPGGRIAEAIRGDLLVLVMSSSFGVKELHRIGEVAKAGCELLRAVTPKGDDAALDDMLAKASNGGYTFGGLTTSMGQVGAETFGARILRDLQPLIARFVSPPRPTRSLDDLVSALTTARAAGLDDIAAGIEATIQDELVDTEADESASTAGASS